MNVLHSTLHSLPLELFFSSCDKAELLGMKKKIYIKISARTDKDSKFGNLFRNKNEFQRAINFVRNAKTSIKYSRIGINNLKLFLAKVEATEIAREKLWARLVLISEAA